MNLFENRKNVNAVADLQGNRGTPSPFTRDLPYNVGKIPDLRPKIREFFYYFEPPPLLKFLDPPLKR
jgi:hypothetical protein